MIRSNLTKIRVLDIAFAVAALIAFSMMHHMAAGIGLAMVGLGRPILTQADLSQHVAALGSRDVVYWPLFDSNSWGTAGQTLLQFFTQPVGQGTTSAPGASGVKTLADTNMTAAGQLTLGNDFFMTGIEFALYPGDNPEQVGGANFINAFLNDTYNAGKSGYATLQVGSNRVYIQDGPLMNFPPSARLFYSGAVGGTNTAGTQSIVSQVYASWVGDPYEITPIYIQATQGFQVSVAWPAAVTLTATARLFNRLRGYLVRNAQ